jgi:hypothetical protein
MRLPVHYYRDVIGAARAGTRRGTEGGVARVGAGRTGGRGRGGRNRMQLQGRP